MVGWVVSASHSASSGEPALQIRHTEPGALPAPSGGLLDWLQFGSCWDATHKEMVGQGNLAVLQKAHGTVGEDGECSTISISAQPLHPTGRWY